MKTIPWRKAVLAFLFFPLLAGCLETEELEHMFYVHAIGIDYRDGLYTVYAQILDFSTFAKQEGGGGDSETEEGAWVGKGTGDSLQDALHQLYGTSQRRIYWGHLNSIILHESLMKLGVKEVFDLITRFSELRYTLWVFGTREPLQDVLLAAPILESTPVFSQIGDPDDVYEQSSFVLRKRLYRIIYELNEPGRTLLVPMLALTPGHWADRQHKFDSLRVGGVAIIENEKWQGWLSRPQLLGLRWVQTETVRTPLLLGPEKQPEAVLMLERPDVQINPTVRNGKAYFTINLELTGTISEMLQKRSESELIQQAKERIRAEIRNTYREGLKKKTDVLNLLDALYRKNLPAWKKLTRSGEEFILDETSLANINVRVRIIASGRTLGPFSANHSKSRSKKTMLIE
ncbi:Ger(x)C family spore germination protein [Brevibacillus marinus]|uniref:Ger(x)C family spore germination protein n=1 Tax=Brevibacillus marinus TaxID=2496837 RepID=UPI000F83A949|nr:Ger(x)C family spore germination protein [Brevibacillus marinus]